MKTNTELLLNLRWHMVSFGGELYEYRKKKSEEEYRMAPI